MRPRLNPEVRYVPCPDGVYVRGPRAARTLQGEQSYQWMDKLAPYLTGEYELDDLTAALSVPQRTNVEQLVTLLAENGFVADIGTDEPHTLTAEDQRTYATEIAFIASVADSAERRFQRHREARVVVLGSGPVAEAIVQAGLRSGLAHLSAPPGGVRVRDRWYRDKGQQVLAHESIAGADIVLHCSGSVAELVETADRCAADGVVLGQVLLAPDAAWITEVGLPGETAVHSVVKRLRTSGALTPEPEMGTDWLTGPVPSLVAAHLVLACFQHSTGLDTLPRSSNTKAAPTATRFDLRTLDTTVHNVVSRAHKPAQDDEELLTSADVLVGQYTGILTRLDEDDLPQFPVFLCRATVNCDGTGEVLGWGADRQVARVRAMWAGLAVYGWLSHRTQPDQAPVGLAAAVTRQAAVEWGLRRHLEALLSASGENAPLVELGDLPLDDRGARLVREWAIAGQHLVVADLSGVFDIPAYALRVADGEMVTCAADPAMALNYGLERLFVAWQTSTDCRDWAPPPAESVASGAVAALTAAVEKAGYRVAVRDLDQDDQLNAVVPHVVEVVLDER